ncbi:MAG: ADP-ribosylglycohydrolase family protein [Armatimonadetes bacterium]|nr:ADP-ribosylglycohydrolase family protein [Armatimonadota bacterium]
MRDVDALLELLCAELRQKTEEGADTFWIAERVERAVQFDEAMGLYRELSTMRQKRDWPFIEPSAWGDIVQRKPRNEKPDPNRLPDQMLGAWLGRCAGCMAGKPVEGWSRRQIAEYIAGAGLDRVEDYLPAESRKRPKRIPNPYLYCTKGSFHRAERDDDTDYSVLGLLLLEKHGAKLTTENVAEGWLTYLPYYQTYTAERVAYKNIVNDEEDPATFMNPYREWIGARIRVDAYAYAHPGNPARAAELAYKDATLSHVKNGVYSAMFFAAAIAKAFVTDDIFQILKAGIAVTPKDSRHAAMVAAVLEWHKQGLSAQDARDAIDRSFFGQYHWVHAVNNDAIALIALLWGWPDFSRCVGLAVEMGLDTDCNAATVGSILGASLGASNLPKRWTKPLKDRLATGLFGMAELRISGLADRTLRLVHAR